MTRRGGMLFVWALLAAFSLAVADASAQDVDPETIVRSLLPKPKPPLMRSLFNRGVSVDPDTPPEPPPQINLTVNFDFDSARLTNDGALTLSALGKALNDPRLHDLRFEIVGHTDAKGSADYNMRLSRQRAETVGAFLYQFYAVDHARLDLYGRGSMELRDPLHPEDGVNRRVQIVTILPNVDPVPQVPAPAPAIPTPPQPAPIAPAPTPSPPQPPPTPPEPTPPQSAPVPPSPTPPQTTPTPPAPAPPQPAPAPTSIDMLPEGPLVRPNVSVDPSNPPPDATPPASDAEDLASRAAGRLAAAGVEAMATEAVRSVGLKGLDRLAGHDDEVVAWTLTQALNDLQSDPAPKGALDSVALSKLLNAAANRVREQSLAIDAAAYLARQGQGWSAQAGELPLLSAHPELAGENGGALLERLRSDPASPLAKLETLTTAGPWRPRVVYSVRAVLIQCLALELEGDPSASSNAGDAAIAPDILERCRPRMEAVWRRQLPQGALPAAPETLAITPSRDSSPNGAHLKSGSKP